MEKIFHEKQEGSLCAQHSLNALLQGEYFTAVDLAALAQQIDEEERTRMAEGGIHSEDYCRFIQQPSGNVDDSGYFSVQVIASALKVWSLELIPYKSQDPIALAAQKNPTIQRAYICNYRDHWLTIRRIGYQWFNLNSLLTGPELVSDTYLSLFLAQLQQEGYSIFIVTGILPDCDADHALRLTPAVQLVKPQLISEVQKTAQGQPVVQNKTEPKAAPQPEEDNALKQALQMSLESSMQAEDAQLQAALTLSLNEYKNDSTAVENESRPSSSVTSERENKSSTNQSEGKSSLQQLSSTYYPDIEEGMSEQEMLEAALKMSMEAS